MQALIAILIAPIAVLNTFAGIIAFIWLIANGQWQVSALGFLALIAAPLPLGLFQMPGLIFGFPALSLAERGHKVLAFPFTLLDQLYTNGVIAAWCVLAYIAAIRYQQPDNLIPLLLGTYAISTGPWIFLGNRDLATDPGSNVVFSIFALEVGLIAAGTAIYFLSWSASDAAIILCASLALNAVFQTVLAFAPARSQPSQYREYY